MAEADRIRQAHITLGLAVPDGGAWEPECLLVYEAERVMGWLYVLPSSYVTILAEIYLGRPELVLGLGNAVKMVQARYPTCGPCVGYIHLMQNRYIEALVRRGAAIDKFCVQVRVQ